MAFAYIKPKLWRVIVSLSDSLVGILLADLVQRIGDSGFKVGVIGGGQRRWRWRIVGRCVALIAAWITGLGRGSEQQNDCQSTHGYFSTKS